ncbi:hypothetical protein HPB47_017574 [Ixodes persulcatus]|uniref:Uncharacterized protein n=1 Tax=Ixodes persulcatus TaxID=34615 RepID=A0AC60QQH2_IXOPE|nr:hypothetical protein HPB47_017574 [Ixodes persulcatus]
MLKRSIGGVDLSPREVCSLDEFHINPRSSTITVSTPDDDRQLAYLQIRPLVIGGKTHEVTAHMATPSDSTQIVVPKALSFDGIEVAEDILLSCIEQIRQLQSRCHRCGAQHPSQNEDGSHYECQPLCAICGGRHITASKEC